MRISTSAHIRISCFEFHRYILSIHCCSRDRRPIVRHGNLNNYTWCHGNSWRSRSWLDLHCRFGTITPVRWPEYTLPSPSLPVSFLSRVPKKIKRTPWRTASLLLINSLIHFTTPWNEMKWNGGLAPIREMKWNEMVRHRFSRRQVKWNLMKCFFFMKFHGISLKKKHPF